MFFKVSFELAADKNDFSNKKRAAKRMLSPARPPPSRLTEEHDGPKGLCVTDHRRDPSPSASVHQVQSILIPPTRSRSTSPHVRYQSSLHEPLQQEVEETKILLHMLLMVPDGKDFNCAPMQPNIYLNCKLLGSDETARSTVSWGQKHPSFGFIQVGAEYRIEESSQALPILLCGGNRQGSHNTISLLFVFNLISNMI